MTCGTEIRPHRRLKGGRLSVQSLIHWFSLPLPLVGNCDCSTSLSRVKRTSTRRLGRPFAVSRSSFMILLRLMSSKYDALTIYTTLYALQNQLCEPYSVISDVESVNPSSVRVLDPRHHPYKYNRTHVVYTNARKTSPRIHPPSSTTPSTPWIVEMQYPGVLGLFP